LWVTLRPPAQRWRECRYFKKLGVRPGSSEFCSLREGTHDSSTGNTGLVGADACHTAQGPAQTPPSCKPLEGGEAIQPEVGTNGLVREQWALVHQYRERFLRWAPVHTVDMEVGGRTRISAPELEDRAEVPSSEAHQEGGLPSLARLRIRMNWVDFGLGVIIGVLITVGAYSIWSTRQWR
jgi:hypothetical protein